MLQGVPVKGASLLAWHPTRNELAVITEDGELGRQGGRRLGVSCVFVEDETELCRAADTGKQRESKSCICR